MADTIDPKGTHHWTVDPAHSSIEFSVRHLGVFNVKGSLGSLTGTGTTVDALLDAATLSIDANTIDTKNADRDNHVKGTDFLNVATYPTIDFVSTSITSTGEGEYEITGNLTIAGQTNPITVTAESVAPVVDPWGNYRAGVTGKGVVKRSEYGITYNSVLETGHVALSDDVKFTFDIQATLVKE